MPNRNRPRVYPGSPRAPVSLGHEAFALLMCWEWYLFKEEHTVYEDALKLAVSPRRHGCVDNVHSTITSPKPHSTILQAHLSASPKDELIRLRGGSQLRDLTHLPQRIISHHLISSINTPRLTEGMLKRKLFFNNKMPLMGLAALSPSCESTRKRIAQYELCHSSPFRPFEATSSVVDRSECLYSNSSGLNPPSYLSRQPSTSF